MAYKPKVGDVFLGKYGIVSLVGEGAFGSVYRARDLKLDRIVAIKFINMVNGVLERFADELDAIKGLDHPNIVRLYDYDILQGGIPCMVMEYVNGREIGDILAQEGTFDTVRICEIAMQTVDALVETHRHGIIHCDLKPENIMLTSVGARADVVKLIDFGVASMLSKNDEERAKTLVGTPQYMAPEQIRHGEIGPWTDIYAMGLILIELFTGQFVFDAEDPREVLKMQLYSPVSIPHKLACSELGPIIAKAVEKDISKRYQSTQQFYNDIREASQTIQSMLRQKPQRQRKESVQARNRAVPTIFQDFQDFSDNPMPLNPKAPGGGKGQSSAANPVYDHSELGLDSFSASLSMSILETDAKLMAAANHQAGHPSSANLGTPLGRTNSSENISSSSLNSAVSDSANRRLNSSVGAPIAPPANPMANNHTPSNPYGMGSCAIRLNSVMLDSEAANIANGSYTSTPSVTDQPAVKVSGSDLSVSMKLSSPAIKPLGDDTNAKTSRRNLKVFIVFMVIMGLACAGFYVYKQGYLDSLLGLTTQRTTVSKKGKSEPIVEANEAEVPAAKTRMLYTEVKDLGEKIALAGNSSAVYGVSKSPHKLQSWKIVGAPTSAGIYINGSRVCHKTPCAVYVFGEPEASKYQIKEKRKSATFTLHDKDMNKRVLINLED